MQKSTDYKDKEFTMPNDYLEGFRAGDEKNAVVQKSAPLRSLTKSDFSLAELKILDIYLARINSHDPSKRTVRLKKGEIEELLGVDRIRKEELSKRIDKLFSPIEIELETPNGYGDAFRKMVLFEYVDLFMGEDGTWEVELTCTEKAMVGIFNIDNIGYLKYKLMNVVNLKSRYSYVLYILLENSIRGDLFISVDDLKKELRCTGTSYDNFKLFNEKIIKPAIKEINEKTTLNCEYDVTRRGRKANGVHFIITRKQQTFVEDKREEDKPKTYPDFSNIPDEYLTPEQLEMKYSSVPSPLPNDDYYSSSKREWK